jgi:hypothetical protein
MTTSKFIGFSMTTIYLALGIASLVISLRNTTDCGTPGYPPLRDYIFGTGIAYTVIGGALGIGAIILVFTVIGIIPLLIIAIFAGPFTFAWMIVGAVSLWRDGGNCQSINYEIWAMGMANVICSIILIIGNLFSYKTNANEAQ